MKRKKGNADRLTAGGWWSRNRWSCVILAAALVLFIVVRMAAVTFEQPQPRGDEYAEYETGVVTDILSDSTEADTVADGGYRGEQLLLAQVRSGQYKGETVQVYNYVGPLYGQPLKVGQRAVLLISTYSDGSHTATVYEYDRAVGLAVIVGLFLLATVLVGGKVGAKSLVALAVTLVCLFWILIPLLMKGASTLLTVFLVCAYITVVTMVILGGVCRKTVCAALGTVAGTALALLFGLLSQSLLRIDGLRLTDVEPLLQLRQTGTPLGLRGLLVAGVVISALGAVMDVAVDLRKGSPTYLQWVSVELSAENKRQFYIPRGFGHGFVTLTDDVDFCYKADNLYDHPSDRSIRFDDPAIGVDWGVTDPILSDKDKNAPLLADSDCNFVYGKGE